MPPVPTDPDAPVGAPLYPPAEWFARPAALAPGQKITVVTDGPDAGRVFGYVAPKKQCILSGRERQECWQVPDSPTNYAAAMQGDALTAEGEVIKVANIGGDVNHAPVEWTNFRKVRDHYSNTASAVMRVAYGADEHGVWCAGALWPEITHRQAEKVRSFALSGDWRWRQELGAYDMAGAQMVPVPGFPLIPTIHARAASLGDPHPALIGGWGGQPMEEPMPEALAPEPTVTLTLTATESARLHALLQGAPPSTIYNIAPGSQTAAAGGCACGGGHTAAPGLEDSSLLAPDGDGDPVIARLDALERQVEELRGQVMSDALEKVDGLAVTASMPLPPDLDDEARWAMPEAHTAAFDEGKHPRHAKGTEGGGRFAPKVGDRVTVQTEEGAKKGEITEEWAPGTFTVATDDGASIEAQTSDLEKAGPKAPGGTPPTVDQLAARTDSELPGKEAEGTGARVMDTSHPHLQSMAKEPGPVSPTDPRVHEVAKAQGVPPGKVVEQANVMKRRHQAGTEGDFQKAKADSVSAVKDENTLDALAGKPRAGDRAPDTTRPDSQMPGGANNPFTNVQHGLLPAGTSTPLGKIVQASDTAYKMEDGSWVPFEKVHGPRKPAEPLVNLR